MTVILAGGTGFIGRRLTAELAGNGHRVILLTRNPGYRVTPPLDGVTVRFWDGTHLDGWETAVDGADAVINLSGEPVAAKRWTPERKNILRHSRIQPTDALVRAIERAHHKPAVLLNASATGFYGDVPSGLLTERAPAGGGFLSDLCVEWEASATRAAASGVRVAVFRFGVVLEAAGGALNRMILPYKYFIGGPLGGGDQWFPWIHREDVVGGILFTLNNNLLNGPVNLTSPTPVTMKAFAAELGLALRRPSWAAVPSVVLRILLGEMAEVLISGHKVIPEKLLEAGYTFRFPALPDALRSILKVRA